MFATSCNSTGRNETTKNRPDEKTRKKVIETSENYINSQISEPKKIVTQDGLIIIGDNFQKYIINPGKIYTGDLNDDSKTDAILTLDRFQGQFQVPSEQLFLLNQGGKLVLAGIMEFDMRVIKLENGVIIAQVPTHPRSSPLFSCEECQDTIRYRFKNGKISRID
jgi:hypothetical protein